MTHVTALINVTVAGFLANLTTFAHLVGNLHMEPGVANNRVSQSCQYKIHIQGVVFEASAGADAFQGEEGTSPVVGLDNQCSSISPPSLAKSPINVNQLEIELRDYKEPDASVLLNGFKSGFSIHYSGPIKSVECMNLKSANQNPDIVRKK